MYYRLDERQSRLIAIDFQYLIGQPLRKEMDIIIEQVEERLMTDGTWQVYLSTYLGDKEGWWQNAGHASMMSNLFAYLTESGLQSDFDPDKYGLTQEDKIQ
ncbi:MAG: hypothetical protein JWO92_501 [Chitinophagaceae bacterium]|nr:hypothetical protein [Chitinophagaceae bacterium]